jgi:hypothetical protein
VKNGTELGIDCSGSCPQKCDGQTCAKKDECQSAICFENKCAPLGTKTCGVGLPTACATGEACSQHADCSTDYCVGAVCAVPTAEAHQDGERNASETDIDCGGKAPAGCAAGKVCKVSDDCISLCNAGKTCDAPSDKDGKKNNGETDIDCGGPNAKKCGTGKSCLVGADCGLGYCPATKCVTPTGADGVQNGTETDVDCGGAAQTFDGVTVPAGPKCALKKKCSGDTDCESDACTEAKRCIEAKSCKQLHGGETCGSGEFGTLAANHESCCRSLPVPGVTVGGKQVFLDKYEITAGRIRQWIKAITEQYNGVPNIQAWVTARMAQDPMLAAMYPANFAVSGLTGAINFLPKQNNNQFATFPLNGGGTTQVDLGLDSQLGPTSYYRGLQIGGTSGCYLGANAYGHRTYWYPAALAQNFSEVPRPDASQDWLDEKSMNCMIPLMFAAFCAWDGGYIQSPAALAAAYGPRQWPWGDTPTPQDEVAKITNYNAGNNFNNAKAPRYLFPAVNYATFANDLSPIIASPGRFVGDIASQSRPAQESWMDLGGNMIEWSFDTTYRGWTGSSFEGHVYPRAWTGGIYALDKYGKGGTRCMRLR